MQKIYSYLSGDESLAASLDLSGIDLELSGPTSDQVLLEGGEATLDLQVLELSVVVAADAERHRSGRNVGVGRGVERVTVDIDRADVLGHLDVGDLDRKETWLKFHGP